ncbi:serine--tRNA ligase, partial [Arthrospira platensis SPKY1]|nr:serine--tRNA ligase [Arthrospira platensis SPKY1]
VDIDNLIKLDETRRTCIAESETLRARRNDVSKQIGDLKKAGKPCDDVMEQMRVIGDRIKELDDQIRHLTEKIDGLLIWIPNIPHESSPVGDNETANRFVREWGTKPNFNFPPKGHIELGENLGILDLHRATRLAGAGFT